MALIAKRMRRYANVTKHTLDGVNGTVHEHAARLGISYGRVRNRILALSKRTLRGAVLPERETVRVLHDLACKACGAPFQSVTLTRLYCHKNCGRRKHYQDKACLVCQRAFSPQSTRQRFCSNKCRNAHCRQAIPKTLAPCQVCGTPIHNRLACKGQCIRIYRAIRRGNCGPVQHESHCKHCRKELPSPRALCQQYCSAKCQRKNSLLSPERKKARNKSQSASRKRCVFKRIRVNMRKRLADLVRNQKASKHHSILKHLGCSVQDFLTHLQSLFKPGMSWGNYGRKGWHMDHIIPCAAFDLTNPKHKDICFHHLNIQPLWWFENSNKQDSLPSLMPDTLRQMASKAGVL